MLLASGTRVRPYEITALLGAGGMGEVYRARDGRLSRDVAIKVLRSGNGDRRRFDLEARSYSRLNHPNIVAIYDVGEEDGSPYIVSELLEGVSLREAMEDGALPLRKLLDVAVQIAVGLAAAHSQDICHRDLKPENVMVLRDGQVKILDFGLAKGAADDSGDETRTAQGIVLGTLAYMSPEQAQGRSTDTRSDQFSLGVILYEMATGTHPFRREDRVSTLSAITREEPPPMAALNPGLPPPVRWVIDRCLSKEPGQRYSSTADLAQHLRDIRDHISEVVTTDSMGVADAVPARKRRWRPAAAALLLLAAGTGAGVFLAARIARPPEYTFLPFATDMRDQAEPAWSPDGRTLAYVAEVDGVRQVFARTLDSSMPARITSALSACRFPFWSADGSKVYYWSAGSIWSVGAAGGEPQPLIRDAAPNTGASSSPDGKTIAFFGAEGPLYALRFLQHRRRPHDGIQATPISARGPGTGRNPLFTGWHQGPDLADSGCGPRSGVVGTAATEGCAVPGQHIDFAWLPRFNGELVIRQPAHSSGLREHARVGQPYLRRGYANRRRAAAYFRRGGGARAFYFARWHSNGVCQRRDRYGSVSGLARRIPGGAAARDVTARAERGMVPLGASVRLSERCGRALQHLVAQHRRRLGTPGRGIGDGGTPRVRLTGVLAGRAAHRVHARRHEPPCLGLKSLRWPDGTARAGDSRPALARAGLPMETGSHMPGMRGRSGRSRRRLPAAEGHCERLANGGSALSRLEWSPAGDSICYNQGDEVYRIPAAGGGAPTLVMKGAGVFTFANNGSGLYVLRRAKDRRWELVKVAPATGDEGSPVPISLPAAVGVTQCAFTRTEHAASYPQRSSNETSGSWKA